MSTCCLDAVFTRAVVTGVRVGGAHGSIYGPIVVREDGHDTVLHEREAEEWLAARGADITVLASSVPAMDGRDGQRRSRGTSGRGPWRPRPALLLFDLVAVLVFVFFRWSGHAEDLARTLVAAVPFLVGAVVGLAVYAAFIGRLPRAFAGITIIELGVLILVWRSLALIVLAFRLDRRAALHARGASGNGPHVAGNRDVIDLDESLERASRTDAAHWGEDRARILDDDRCRGMVSVRFPLALVTPDVVPVLAKTAPDVVVVTIDEFFGDGLRGSAEVLRSTVLPNGWEIDFDTEAFSANDPFGESV